ncbi:MAG: hypothetical protein RL701_5498 [Pseudomonadota bacterium]
MNTNNTLTLNPTLNYRHFRRAAKYVVSNPQIGECEATKTFIDEAAYRHRYFTEHKVLILHKEVEIPHGLHGYVVKRSMPTSRGHRSTFLVVTRPIDDRFVRQFILANKIGHILLHGRYMPSDIALVDPIPLDSGCVRHRAEIEANIYSMLALVPARAIELLDELVGPGQLSAGTLHEALSRLFKIDVDRNMVAERLLLHRTLALTDTTPDDSAPSDLVNTFEHLVARPQHAWLKSGPSAQNNLEQRSSGTYVSAELFKKWRLDMERCKVLVAPTSN